MATYPTISPTTARTPAPASPSPNSSVTLPASRVTPTTYIFNDGALNRIGYDLLERDRVSDAITVFQLNAEEYPKVANVYDSLAEAYAKAGNRRLAIENYKRSLELDLKNQNAIDHLKDLEKP